MNDRLRLMTDSEICVNFNTTIGCDSKKIKRLMELNPCYSRKEIIAILVAGGCDVKKPNYISKPRSRTTPEYRDKLRMENDERMRVPISERETIKHWADRLGISTQTLSIILRTTEEDYEETRRKLMYEYHGEVG